MKLSDAINQAEETLRQIQNEIADHGYWGGPDVDPPGTAAMMQSATTMKQMINHFKSVTEL
jgi:hypothetical protein